MSKYEKGNVVTGAISGIESYGVFVNLEGYYSGLIHISEISYDFIDNLNDNFQVGQLIKAKVIDVDDDTFHVKLSIKDLNYKSRKIKRTGIVEKGSGFDVLKDKLDDWIQLKMTEIK